jgi:hypothetical protein
VIALSLAILTRLFAGTGISSISESYYAGGWSQSIFIGFLFAIAAFLFAYNGLSKTEMIFSKVAALAGLGVALFPCRCETHTEIIPYVHGISAAVMFLVLTYFCYCFFRTARSKGHPQAQARATIYAVCGIAILLSIVTLAFDHFFGGTLRTAIPHLTFYGEAISLSAFGISWLIASRVLPGVTRPEERFSPLRENNPP